MSVTHWSLAEPTTTTAVVVCRSNATGTITVGCNGQTFTAAANAAVQDGIVAITVTGLAAGTQYAYTIDGVAAGTLKTLPSNPTEVWIGSGSCWVKNREDVLARKLLADYDVSVFHILGDFPYANDARNLWGESTTDVTSSIAAGQSAANYYAHHRQIRGIPGMRELLRNVPTYYMPDDHEYPYDNARKADLAGYRAGVTGASAATQADLDAAWAASRAASEAYGKGWTRGFNASGTAMDADALYGSYKIGSLVEVFQLDCINYADPVGNTDNASKQMLGAAQYARLVEAVPASTATWKLIVIPKQFWQGGNNDDTWVPVGANLGYLTQRNALMYALRNVTGLLAVAGDQHLYSDQWVSANDLGAGYPAMSCLVGCPTTVDLNTSGVAGYPTGVRSKANGYASTTDIRQENVVALFKFSATRADRYLLSTTRGLVPMGYITAGSNQVQIDRPRFG